MPAADGASAAPAVVFPGQGVDRESCVAALRAHADDPLVHRLQEATGLADLGALDMRDTRLAQPAVYTAGLLAALARFPGGAGAAMTFGHSLGEITALAFAGSVDPVQGLALTVERGRICSDTTRPGRMIAVMGLTEVEVEWLRRTAVARSDASLDVGAYNGPTQVVLSGDVRAVEEAVRVAGELGALAQELPIGGAFHSPVLAPVLGAWEAAVAALDVQAPRVPFLSCVEAAPCTSAEDVRRSLVRAILLPVRWQAVLMAARDLGVHTAWDAGPGETLRKLGRRAKVLDFVDEPARAGA